ALTGADTAAWANSRVLDGDLVDAVKHERRDVVITGSLSVVQKLMAEDLVDEYRLLTFPTVLGTGHRLFPTGSPPTELKCLSAERVGAAVLTRYRRASRCPPASSPPGRGSVFQFSFGYGRYRPRPDPPARCRYARRRRGQGGSPGQQRDP